MSVTRNRHARSLELDAGESTAELLAQISALRRENEELRASKDRLRIMLEEQPECVKVVARDGELLDMNPAGLAILEAASLEEARTRPLVEFVAPQDRAAFIDAHARVMAGARVTLEFEVVGLRGGRRWLETHAAPQRGPDGGAIALIGVTRDVTERRRADAALREAEARLRLALRAGNIGTWDWHVATGQLVWSEIHEQMWGFAPHTFPGTVAEFIDRIHPEDRPEMERVVEDALAHGTTFAREYRVRWPDGTERWILGQGEVFRDERGTARRMLGVVIDITDHKRQEAALRASMDTFAIVFRSSPVPFIVMRMRDERIIAVNAALEAVTGFTADELVGRSPAELRITEPGPEREQRLAELRETGRLRMREISFRRKNGERALCLCSAEVVSIGGEPCMVATALDMTEQKKLETQFLHAQRMEAVGTLATGIAHDLNNILAPMLMGAGVLRARLPDTADHAILDIIEQSGGRGAKIVQQLLSFCGNKPAERTTIAPRPIMDEIGRIVRETFPRSIQIELAVEPNLSAVEADSTQLHQVLLNLCVNARDAMPSGGTLTLAAENVRLADGELDSRAKAGDWVELRVSDTGEGIAPENLNRIFEPFFSTKGVGQGSGLGLSTALGIVQAHGGFMKVGSTPGRGATFRVFLPASSQAASSPPASATPTAHGSGEVILLVDDEEALREAIAAALRHRGYEVIAAADGAEGLRKFLSDRDRIKLVLTDMTMPVLDGLKLALAVREVAPTLPIALTSGLHAEARVRSLPPGTITEFLPKPIRFDQLFEMLGRHLRSR